MPEEKYYLHGVTKLRNKIYLLCLLRHGVDVIRVLEDRPPFRLKKEIEIKEISLPWDITSSEKESCLYISDHSENCVWKFARESDDQHKIIKWLTTDYHPRILSVSSDGQLLMINYSSHALMIYGSDAELLRSIPLPREIKYPDHAAETPIGNFVIIHPDADPDDDDCNYEEVGEEKEESLAVTEERKYKDGYKAEMEWVDQGIEVEK